MKYQEMFQAGNKAQLEKMIENEDKKSGWDNIGLGFASCELINNAECIHRYVKAKNIDQSLLKDGLDEMIRAKAANVANFAHMIILQCDKELNK